jgi:hypothetical protein
VLLDDEAFFAVIALNDVRRAIAKLGVDVAIPQIERLEDVAVGIDNVISAGDRIPSGAAISSMLP